MNRIFPQSIKLNAFIVPVACFLCTQSLNYITWVADIGPQPSIIQRALETRQVATSIQARL